MNVTVEIETFTEDQRIELGLIAVARHNGNTRRAAKELKGAGIEVAHQTLHRWMRTKYADRYQKIREQCLPAVRTLAADKHMELAELNAKAEKKMLARLNRNVDEIPARDLPGAIRNAAVAGSIHTERAEDLNDQPNVRVAIDLAGTLQELKSLGVEPTHVLNLEPVSEEDVDDD